METRIVIVAPVKIVRESVADRIERDGSELRVTGTYPSAAEAVHDFGEAPADVVLVDAMLGIESVRHLRSGDHAPIVAVLGIDDDDALEWMEAGATGMIPKDADLHQLVETLRRASRGEMVCSPRLTATLARRVEMLASRDAQAGRLDILTGREMEIAGLLQEGLSNKEIARRLRIRPATVKNHVHRILEKLNLRRRGEVGALFRRGSSG